MWKGWNQTALYFFNPIHTSLAVFEAIIQTISTLSEVFFLVKKSLGFNPVTEMVWGLCVEVDTMAEACLFCHFWSRWWVPEVCVPYNTLVNVYVDLLVFTRIAGTS